MLQFRLGADSHSPFNMQSSRPLQHVQHINVAVYGSTILFIFVSVHLAQPHLPNLEEECLGSCYAMKGYVWANQRAQFAHDKS